MNQASNIGMSISLVRKELEATLQKAEGYFSRFAESQDQAHLKSFADELNLARGIFKLLELLGPEALTTEMLSLVGDGTTKVDAKLEALGRGLLSLSHYIGILLEHEKDHPILLIPAINLVRKTGSHKALPESHFFNVNLRPKLPQVEKSGLDIKPHLSRLRLMYQLGLLRVLNGPDPVIGLKLIQRALVLLERGFRGTIAWPFWWCCKAAVDAIIAESFELTNERKVLFGRIDLVMRTMIKDGAKVFTAQLANEVHKDLLHIVSLSACESGDIPAIKQSYLLQGTIFERELKKERRFLAGPDVGAYESLSKAFKEEIHGVKEALDSAAKNALSDDGFNNLSTRLSALADVLSVINQEPLSQRLKEQHSNVQLLPELDDQKKITALAQIADAMLQVELASSHFASGKIKTSSQEIIGAGHYFEARIILFDETVSGIGMAKRAIASYVEMADKLHLNNVAPALKGVKGALIFLNELKAANVIDVAIKYLTEKVLNADTGVDEARLEVLADALTSIEYHCEALAHSDAGDQAILDLAVKSMAQLGYRVS